MRNMLAKALKSAPKILKGEISKIFAAQDKKEARRLAQILVDRYQDHYPSAIACLKEDLEECLAHLALPAAHHKVPGILAQNSRPPVDRFSPFVI